MRRSILVCARLTALIAVLQGPEVATANALFLPLGDLPGLDLMSAARDVSPDGSAVVGFGRSSSGNEGFRWTADGGMVGVGDLPGGAFQSEAWATSGDGTIVAGDSTSASGTEAFRWVEGSGIEGLGDLPGGDVLSRARGISADGSVVVGESFSSIGPEPFRWTAQDGMVALGGGVGAAYGVSADGSIIVGQSGSEAFRWTMATGMVGLGDLPGGSFLSAAYDISSDGTVVVGVGTVPGQNNAEAFRWTAEEGMVGLGNLPKGDATGSVALGVSANGSVVVGNVNTDSPHAFVWYSDFGMRPLQGVLELWYGLDLTGWTLQSATDVSDDGRTIVGYGINPNGETEAFLAVVPVAVIPEPSSGLLLAAGLTILWGVRLRGRSRTHLGA
jgi:probable HAF family extracellular repeat protein